MLSFEGWASRHMQSGLDASLAKPIWNAAQAAERERIKSRVKEAAENLWCIRNQVGEEPYSLYIGPSLNTMEEFVNRLLEET